MTAEEVRKVKVTYCDYCGKELHTPYTTIVSDNGGELDFCSDYKDGGKNCLQKWREDGRTINHAAQQKSEIKSTSGTEDKFISGELSQMLEETLNRRKSWMPTKDEAEKVATDLMRCYLKPETAIEVKKAFMTCFEWIHGQVVPK